MTMVKGVFLLLSLGFASGRDIGVDLQQSISTLVERRTSFYVEAKPPLTLDDTPEMEIQPFYITLSPTPYPFDNEMKLDLHFKIESFLLDNLPGQSRALVDKIQLYQKSSSYEWFAGNYTRITVNGGKVNFLEVARNYSLDGSQFNDWVIEELKTDLLSELKQTVPDLEVLNVTIGDAPVTNTTIAAKNNPAAQIIDNQDGTESSDDKSIGAAAIVSIVLGLFGFVAVAVFLVINSRRNRRSYQKEDSVVNDSTYSYNEGDYVIEICTDNI